MLSYKANSYNKSPAVLKSKSELKKKLFLNMYGQDWFRIRVKTKEKEKS